MKIIALTKDLYEAWDKFCLESNDAWLWHTTDWLEYTLNLRPSLKTQNYGFFVYKGDRIVAIVPLALETKEFGGNNYREFSFDGAAIPVPALDNALNDEEIDVVHEYIFNEIDRLAVLNKVASASFRQVPIANSSLFKRRPFNYLLKYGFVDISLNTQLIDLNKSEADLWDNLRRNHRRNIKKDCGLKTLIFTAENVTRDIFTNYKEMHHKAAGRKTRPDITFELMYNWIKQGTAFLVVVVFNDKQVGFEYYSVYKNNVYGFSAANDPEYEYLPIRHLLEWKAILWMRGQGFSYYEIGLQQYGILPHNFPDKKQKDISHFKKGFGGFAVSIFMGEKYYSKKYCRNIFNSRKEKFLSLYDFDKYSEIVVEARPHSAPKRELNVENGIDIPSEELMEVVCQVVNENKTIINGIKKNPKAVNYIIGKIKKQLGDNFRYELVERLLKEALAKSNAAVA